MTQPMPNRAVNPTINKRATDSLWKNSQYFVKALGKPSEEGNELIFPLKDLPFTSFKIRYDIEKKFLGRIYVMVLEAKFCRQKIFHTSERIELRYSGFFKKGRPYFRPVKTKDDGHGVLQLLNGDQRLIEECSKLDIEFLTVFFDFREEIWKVEVKPYAGSFIDIMFPPIRYNVLLVNDQANLILSIMENIARRIAS